MSSSNFDNNFDINVLYQENQKLRAEVEYLKKDNLRLQERFRDHTSLMRRKISLVKNVYSEIQSQYQNLRFRENLKAKMIVDLDQKIQRLSKAAFRRYVRRCSFCGDRKTLKLTCNCRICEKCFPNITHSNDGTCFHFDREG